MIKEFHITIGFARDEDRAPSHDGEYLAVYYREGHPDEYLVEDNAGCPASHLHTIVDAVGDALSSGQRYTDEQEREMIQEAEELQEEILEGLRTGSGDIAKHCGTEAIKAMREWGWLTKDQTDGNWILQ